MRISTKPGSINQGANHTRRFVKVCFLSFIMCLCLNLAMRGRGKFHYQQFYNFKPAGSRSIILRHMKSISVLSLPWSIHGLIKSTHTASQGVIVASLAGSFPYLCKHLLFTWQDWQFLTYEHTVEHICLHYIAAISVSSRQVFRGCCR